MLSTSLILVAAVAYLLLLFAIAWWGDSNHSWHKAKPVVYSLGLGVYCTSWAFYGVAGQAAQTGWWLTPTYAGSIIVYLLAWPLVLKVARICRDNNLTSLADFVATRYGRSVSLSALISLVSIIAIVPYISLQIRAVANSVDLITGEQAAGSNSAFLFTLLLAVFAILFGTRRIRTSEHNPGLMLAIAFESIVKLVTFVSVGIFVCFFMFDGVTDIFSQAEGFNFYSDNQNTWYTYLTQTVIGVLMMFCLPRQFHVCFIEQDSEKEMATSRWLFPIFLVALNFFALPIATGGLLWFQSSEFSPDSVMLLLPIAANSQWMTLVSFIGGFAAATSMVIIASIVLSIMVSNDLITPWLVKKNLHLQPAERLNPQKLILIRRTTIIVVLLASWLYHLATKDVGLLANTGLMAMTLVAQFSPALLLGLLWRRANKKAAFYSILTGTMMWVYTLLLPTLLLASYPHHPLLIKGLFGVDWLMPTAMFDSNLDFISHGLIMSLGSNVLVFIWMVLKQTPHVSEQLQAAVFFHNTTKTENHKRNYSPLTHASIQSLLSRFVETLQVDQFFKDYYGQTNIDWQETAPKPLMARLEQELSAIIGGASAKLVLDSASGSNRVALSEVVELVDEASEVYRFNRALLQSTIQNIDQGISVVDKELRLVAWNRRYVEMFQYPEDVIYVGRPVEEVIRYNANRGLFGDTSSEQIESEVSKRVNHLKTQKNYSFRRVHSSGKVLEMKGNPLPGGGFVNTYTDITEFVENQKALQEMNVHLEKRVAQRTQDIQAVNVRLEEARQLAVQANEDKTKYFAAISHDLLQPFNAATLFCSILKEKLTDDELRGLSENIQSSLDNAEQLVNSVLELTKLDAGAVATKLEDVDIASILLPLVEEYQHRCRQKGLRFDVNMLHAFTRTDVKLLKRVFQNLLSNAVRYTEQGHIALTIEVLVDIKVTISDSGEGIKEEDQSRVFKDFEQVSINKSSQGLGLGLAITSRICRILGHDLELQSTWQQGSAFTVSLPLIKGKVEPEVIAPRKVAAISDLKGVTALVIDNESNSLEAMALRLETWGCRVYKAKDEHSALDALSKHAKAEHPHIVVADYHLDEGHNGIDLAKSVRSFLNQAIPVIINSADQAEMIREMAIEEGFSFIAKPIKPATLKRLIKKNINRH